MFERTAQIHANSTGRVARGVRPPSLIAGVLLTILAGVALVFVAAAVRSGPPARGYVEEELVFGGDLLAYEVWDGIPHVVFRLPNSPEARHDVLRKDWVSIEWPPLPAWQLSGDWARLPVFLDPASVGLIRGDSTVLFGDFRDDSIRTFETEYKGEWHVFPVSDGAFLVRLEGFDGVPTGFRWLDSSGGVVWSATHPVPLLR